MANVKLSNTANVVGNYDSIPTTLTSEAIITEMISGLTIVKTADKQNWATGNLTYTITITNNADNPFEAPKFTDILDPSLIKLVDDSVQVNGTASKYTYDASSGLLSIELETIANTESTIITFQVQKA